MEAQVPLASAAGEERAGLTPHERRYQRWKHRLRMHQLAKLIDCIRVLLMMGVLLAGVWLLASTRPPFIHKFVHGCHRALHAVIGNRTTLVGYTLGALRVRDTSDASVYLDRTHSNDTEDAAPQRLSVRKVHLDRSLLRGPQVHFDYATRGQVPDQVAQPQVNYTFVSTTWPPQQTKSVPCLMGQEFPSPNLLQKNLPKFIRLPPESEWESIWTRIRTGLGLNDQTCATPLRASIRLPSPHHGFGSQMNNFVNEVFVSMYSGMPISLCAPLGTNDVWANHFVNPGLPRCSECSLPPPDDMDAPMVWCSGANASMHLANENPDALIAVKRFIFKQLFKLRPETDSAVTALQQKLGILYEPYVGVHIRRGDKLSEAGFFRKPEAFAQYAIQLCDAMGARKVFVASDDPPSVDEFRRHMRNDIQVVAQPPQSPEEYAERGNLDQHTEQVLINDVILLKRANAFVGTASSSLGRWVWFQRDTNTQSISLDDGGSFLFRSC